MLAPQKKRGVRWLPSIAAVIAIFVLARSASGQVITVNESFTEATLPTAWTYGGDLNSNPGTPFLPTASGGSAGMTLTTSSGNESTFAYDPSAFNSANATIATKFTYTASNGTAVQPPTASRSFWLTRA
jgi:hypothetical protein